MKNVSRLPVPSSIRENSEKWTKDLLAAIDNYNKTGEEIPVNIKNKYKQTDVLDTLKEMYSDRYGNYYCCYCESPIQPVSYPHIEHRKPKDKDYFPEEAFNWDNLHLVCQVCNTNKLNKWDAENEILDAVNDIPIEEHLGYRIEIPEGVYRETFTPRGITTVNHADLDREDLRSPRIEIWKKTIDSIKEIQSFGNDSKVYTAKKILIEKCNGKHGSLIKWVLKDWKVIE